MRGGATLEGCGCALFLRLDLDRRQFDGAEEEARHVIAHAEDRRVRIFGMTMRAGGRGALVTRAGRIAGPNGLAWARRARAVLTLGAGGFSLLRLSVAMAFLAAGFLADGLLGQRLLARLDGEASGPLGAMAARFAAGGAGAAFAARAALAAGLFDGFLGGGLFAADLPFDLMFDQLSMSSMARESARETIVSAAPDLPARPVRPIRCT